MDKVWAWGAGARNAWRKALEKDLNAIEVMLIRYPWSREIAHKREYHIRLPKDAKGLKIRTTGAPMKVASLKAWGMNPTPVAWSETYTALKQGVINGTYNAKYWIYETKLHEVINKITQTRFNFIHWSCFIMKRAWIGFLKT